ncbi:carbonic anhydrase [Dongia sp.]|jgi:carbonic anhydrase|uniref:carbonic anhydrase n=1 Tax=Dongia sp. TaxID=1977262 RepID=UPI0035AFCED3
MSGHPVSRRNLLGKMTVGSLAVGTGLVGLTAPWRHAALAEGAPHWTYEGPEGPSHWGQLAPDFGVCGTGQRQSPIDLAGAGLDQAADLALEWQSYGATVENNGHTLQVAAPDGTPSALTLGGRKYGFLQFHFHHPSEHAVGGGRWPLEVHMVHKSEAGDLAVTGIFFRPGRENDVLGAILAQAPATKGKKPMARPVDMNRFLPASNATYRYAGSLTTPPCSEIVSWIVFREPVEAAIGQIESFARLFPMNARPLQHDFQRGIALDLF